MPIETPLEFAEKIAECLALKPEQVDDLFLIDEDKEGYFVATLYPKRFLDKNQFKLVCGLVKDLDGEGYLQGAKAWKIPGPMAKTSPKPISEPVPTSAGGSETSPSGVIEQHYWMPSIKDFEEQRCVLCDSLDNLVIHHKRYGPNLTIKDFVILCRSCHTKYHIGGRGNPDYSIDVCGRTICYVWGGRKWHCKLCMDSVHIISVFDSEAEFIEHCITQHPTFVTYETVEHAEKERTEQWKNEK